MNIPIRQSHRVTILDPQGKIAIGVGDVAVREAVQSALEAGSRRILVNLSGVPSIDSAGIGELLSVHTTVTDHGGQLKLATPPKRMRELLERTQLVDVLQIFSNEADALGSFVREETRQSPWPRGLDWRKTANERDLGRASPGCEDVRELIPGYRSLARTWRLEP